MRQKHEIKVGTETFIFKHPGRMKLMRLRADTKNDKYPIQSFFGMLIEKYVFVRKGFLDRRVTAEFIQNQKCPKEVSEQLVKALSKLV